MIERVLDFETVSMADLKKVGSRRYAEDPTTSILCLSYEGLDSRVKTWFPGEDPGQLWLLAHNPEVCLVAHNAGFEKDIWRCIMVPVFDFPDVPNNRWVDTMATCAMKVIPQDLDTGARVLRLPVQKDTEGKNLVIGLSRLNKKTGMLPPITPDVLQRAAAYCEDDVRTERAMLDRIDHLSPGEHKVWLLDQRINERGIRVDLDYIDACQRIVDLESGPLEEEVKQITGGLRVTQIQKLQQWCKDDGAFVPNFQKDTLAEILGKDEDMQEVETDAGLQPLPDHVRRVLEVRQLIGSASIKKLARMRAAVCADGRIYRLLAYHGAGPGRWAGRIVQPQNFPRPTTKVDEDPVEIDTIVNALMSGDPDLVRMTLGPPVETVISGLRHALIAKRGGAFLAGDFATIEARIVLALAGQHDKTAIMAEGKDIYIDMAQQIFGRPIDKKKDPEERQAGKNSVLGLGFQMGATKFRSRYAKNKPMDFAQRVVDIYRKEWAPKVPKLWYALGDAATKAVWNGTPQEAYGVLYQLEDGWLTARLPSGRKLWYWNPQKRREAMPWDDEDIRPAWSYEALKMGKWTTIHAFGGLLTENVVQALARDLLVAAMFKLEKNGFPLVLTVHDEALAEVDENQVDEVAFNQIMCDGTPWSRALQVPVAVETWAGERYRK